jgi:hypothetical protein
MKSWTLSTKKASSTIGADAVRDLALHESRPLEHGIGFVPARLGTAQRVVMGQRGRGLLREQPLVGTLRCRKAKGDTLACGELRLQSGEGALQVGRQRRPETHEVLVHACDHQGLVLKQAHLNITSRRMPVATCQC